MTLNDLLRLNKEIDSFDFLIIVDEEDKRLKTCRIVTELCISKDYENLEVVSTRKVSGVHKVDGICYSGVYKTSQKGGLIVEVLSKI